jgi:aspartokinase-like uncharacterized kinase
MTEVQKFKDSLEGAPHLVIVTGGRDFNEKQRLIRALDALAPSLIMHGNARGADTLADLYAVANGLPVARFPANWELFGKKAGPTRNRWMLQSAAAYADGGWRVTVLACPGGAGTADMVRQSKLGMHKVVMLDNVETRR